MKNVEHYENKRNYHGAAGILDGCQAGLRWNSPSLNSGNALIQAQQEAMYTGAYISTQLAGFVDAGVYMATQISLPIEKIRIHINENTGRPGGYLHALVPL